MEEWTEDAGIEAVAADAEAGAGAGAAEMRAVGAEVDPESASSAESAQPAVPAAKASVPERLSRTSAGGENGALQPAQLSAPDSEIGPAEAAPHWRAFYGAIRDAVQGMRSGDKTE